MMNLSSTLLSANGLLVLLIGFLCGAPLGSAINKGEMEAKVRAWRVAHSSLVGGGVMLLAIAPNLPSVELPQTLKLIASSLLCISAWSFTFALTFGAWKGHRGTAPETGIGSTAAYFANILGVVLSMASALMFTWGAGLHLLRALSAT
ncbi:hypothetical protein AB4Z46_11310 [Variovorax sp. M-6]|uniref:hypothetical protein n=1 Tax=Variovorax sp. M-6 TaxID=3233041 RepID=UPI003F9956C8